MNPGSYEHETCSKKQLIPYSFRAYQYLKIELWTKVAPFLKSAHIPFTKTIIVMQSHHCSFLSRLLEIWSAFSNRDKTTSPLVLRSSIVDVSYTLCPRCKVGAQSILYVLLCSVLEGLPENEVLQQIWSFSTMLASRSSRVNSRQEKQLFASLTVQTPLLRSEMSR